MKEEIKLKYMIDFLENVYKDIKKQPRFEEELEKERKFINKIKGDNEDEVKELLEHIEILDNTDYILHSDKAKALLDYIENLQSQLKAKEEVIKEARNLLCEADSCIMKREPMFKINARIIKAKEILSKGENK